MAITNVIDGVAVAVDEATAVSFAVTSASLLTADNFALGENARVLRLGPSGDYIPATNKDGAIVLSAIPNMALLEGPARYKVTKDVTVLDGYVGREE